MIREPRCLTLEATIRLGPLTPDRRRDGLRPGIANADRNSRESEGVRMGKADRPRRLVIAAVIRL